MNHARQMELMDRLVGIDPHQPWFLGPASLRNPSAAYTDPARFDAELKKLFRGRPQFVGLSDECRAPGDFLAVRLGGVPIVVIRQTDGTMRALINVCRHRGATLLAGAGNLGTRRVVCAYHGWTYDHGGKLLNRPLSAGGFDDVDMNCDLHRRAVVEQYGMIFVNPSSDRPFTADDVLTGMETELSAYDLGGYVHIETRTNTWRANWKLILDTFTESYHIRWLHKDSISPFFLVDTLYDGYGPNFRSVGLRKDILAEIRDKPRQDWRLLPFATTQYFIVPNALVVYQVDHIEVWRITPVSVDETQITTSLFAAEAPPDERTARRWTKNLDILLNVTGSEDFPVQEQIQRNLASGALAEVVYGRVEPGLVHLHTSINAMLGQAGK